MRLIRCRIHGRNWSHDGYCPVCRQYEEMRRALRPQNAGQDYRAALFGVKKARTR